MKVKKASKGKGGGIKRSLGVLNWEIPPGLVKNENLETSGDMISKCKEECAAVWLEETPTFLESLRLHDMLGNLPY